MGHAKINVILSERSERRILAFSAAMIFLNAEKEMPS